MKAILLLCAIALLWTVSAQNLWDSFNLEGAGLYQASGTQYFSVRTFAGGHVFPSVGTNPITFIIAPDNQTWFFNDTSCVAWYLNNGSYVICQKLVANTCFFIPKTYEQEITYVSQATLRGFAKVHKDGLFSNSTIGEHKHVTIYSGWLGDTLQCTEKAANTFYIDKHGRIFAWTQDDGIVKPPGFPIQADAYYQFTSWEHNPANIQFQSFNLDPLCYNPANVTTFCNTLYPSNANFDF